MNEEETANALVEKCHKKGINISGSDCEWIVGFVAENLD